MMSDRYTQWLADKEEDEGASSSKKAKYVVRPAPIPPPPKYVETNNEDKAHKHHPLDRFLWSRVFTFLPQGDLARCLRVCKTFYRWGMDASLWIEVDLRYTAIKQNHLLAIVRRQPKQLDLTGSNISHQQLGWLAPRLPLLKHLGLSKNSWAAVSSLCTSSCPLLFSIDLSWVPGVRTQCLRDLLAPPGDRRPGVDDSVSRFHRCTSFNITGTDITDQALEYIASWLPKLQELNVSYCVHLTPKGIENLAKCEMLNKLHIESCHGIKSLEVLDQLPSVETVVVGSGKAQLAKKFVAESNSKWFKCEDQGVIVRK